MIQLGFNLSLKDSYDKIRDNMFKAIKTKMNQALRDCLPDIESKLHVLIRNSILATPEVDSMLNGQLKGELGLKDPQVYIDEIIATIQDHTVVAMHPLAYSGNFFIRGGLTIKFLRSNHNDVLLLPIASYKSTHGYDVEWLKWLLTRGDDIILVGYRIETHFTSGSRSGQAIMVKVENGIWFVPSQFSGVIGANFLTRAFVGSENAITKIVEESLGAKL